MPLSPQWLKNLGRLREKQTLCCQTLGILLSWLLAATLAWLCLSGAQDHLWLLRWLLAVAVIALTIALFTLCILRTGEWLPARQQALAGSGSWQSGWGLRWWPGGAPCLPLLTALGGVGAIPGGSWSSRSQA